MEILLVLATAVNSLHQSGGCKNQRMGTSVRNPGPALKKWGIKMCKLSSYIFKRIRSTLWTLAPWNLIFNSSSAVGYWCVPAQIEAAACTSEPDTGT